MGFGPWVMIRATLDEIRVFLLYVFCLKSLASGPPSGIVVGTTIDAPAGSPTPKKFF